MNQVQFENWYNDLISEGKELDKQYKYLSDQEKIKNDEKHQEYRRKYFLELGRVGPTLTEEQINYITGI